VPLRVLVVDDEPTVVESLREILRQAGYEPICATSFEEGHRALLEDPAPDILVADIRLGDFNGLQLVAVRPPSTAAVVMSGHWDNTLEAEARKHGALYLPKPMSANMLVGTIKQVLAGREGGGSSG
jgi:DNA-binding NtrC family response regulator